MGIFLLDASNSLFATLYFVQTIMVCVAGSHCDPESQRDVVY